MSRVLSLVVLAGVLAACFNPSYDNPMCSPAGECPDGLTCVQGVCRSADTLVDAPIDVAEADAPDSSPIDAADAAMVDAAVVDAAIDAPVIDARVDAAVDAAVDAPPIDGPVVVCGNGVVTPPEVCDDGNTVTETSCPYGTPTCTRCNATCTTSLSLSGPFCGDAVVQAGSGEGCDDGNTVSTDNCKNNCQPNVCGDFLLDNQAPRTDTCDDGNMSNADDCVNVNGECRPARCGDGFVDMQGPVVEVCDDGNTIDTDGCRNNCTPTTTTCGNGMVNPGEQCDSGGVNTPTCDSDCTSSSCGDGHWNPAANEECDEGPNNGNPSGCCTSLCRINAPVC